MKWNGYDIISYAQVLELSRPDAARWWTEFCAPCDAVGVTREAVAGLAQALAPADEREQALAAYLYAAECAGVLAEGE